MNIPLPPPSVPTMRDPDEHFSILTMSNAQLSYALAHTAAIRGTPGLIVIGGVVRTARVRVSLELEPAATKEAA